MGVSPKLERIVDAEPAFYNVYDGVDAETGEAISIKVFAGEPDAAFTRRFLHAAERRAAVRHPHLLNVYGASEVEGRLVLATEPCDLPTLADRLQAGPPAHRETLEILGQVADALDAAARAGIVDHELSPSSIMLHPARGALLGDLGILASLIEGLPPWIRPNPRYLSPEAVHGEPLESASNVYSLACILLECLTGAPPFDGSVQLIAYSHAAEEPPAPTELNHELGSAFDSVMRVALAKAPGDRFPSARALIDAAASALTDEEQPVAPPPKRRLRPRLALAAVPLAAVVAVAGYLAGDAGESPKPIARSAPPSGPSPALVTAAHDLDATVARLDRRLGAGRERLAAARTPAQQARAAAALARGYRTTASEMSNIGTVPGLDSSAVARTLPRASRGYARLAEAARAGDGVRFDAARKDVAAAEAALRRELARLRPRE